MGQMMFTAFIVRIVRFASNWECQNNVNIRKWTNGRNVLYEVA
jgi:hypothetical protein